MIDDVIADEALNKRRQPLLGLAVSGRHKGHSLWLLTESYTAVPMNIRRQVKIYAALCLVSERDCDTIHEENDVIETLEELASVKKQLKGGKHTCLVMRMEHLRAYEIVLLTNLLKDVYKTPIKTPTVILSKHYRMLVSKIQHSCQEATALLSRHYITPIKTPTTLLSRDHRTHISKMIEYLSFILQCTSVVLLRATACYLYFRTKTLLRMAKSSFTDSLLEVTYDPPKSDPKRQKLIECALTRNSKQCLGKAYTKKRINELSEEEVDKLFSNYEAKLSGQMVKS